MHTFRVIQVVVALVCVGLVALAIGFDPGRVAAMPAPDQALVLADFDGESSRFPKGWEAREGQAAAERVYRIEAENGEKFLHAAAHADSVQIGLPVSFTLREYPKLSWRWRVGELPQGANERNAATNDSAAGVYVVFKGGLGGLLPRAIKYVWSAQEPCGTTLTSPRYSNVHIVVLESGNATGEWRTETVDVAADYRRLFQAEPAEPRAIAVLTDANDTGTRAVADYDDFRALPTAVAGGAPPANITSQAR